MNRALPPASSLAPLIVVGHGKLGAAVARAWEEAGGTVETTVGRGDRWTPRGLVFEATSPDAALENVLRCVENGVPVVTGTTGWLEDLNRVEAALANSSGTVLWSTNFSPGIHALNLIASHASGVMARLEGYEAQLQEVHHVQKKDAPSGTALTLQHFARQGGWDREIQIESVREGDVVGLHRLAWESAHDCVALQHEAKSRLGFAQGAVWALRWTAEQHKNKAFGLYTMTDLFST